MPLLRQKRAHYYAIFYDPDRRPMQKWVTLRTKNKGVAMRKLVDLEKEHAAGRFDPWLDAAPELRLSFAKATERFLRRPDLRPDTKRVYAGILRLFGKSLPPDLLLASVQPVHVDRFCNRRELSDASRATYYRHVRAFFTWAVKAGLTKTDAAAQVERPRAGRREAHFFMPRDIEALIAAVEMDDARAAAPAGKKQRSWLVDVIRFAVATGLRRGELVNLRWSDVELESGFLVVRNHEGFRTKSGHDRRVPLVADAYEIVRRLHQERCATGVADRSAYVLTGASGGQISATYLSKRFRHYRREAGFPEELHFHSLRHTAASWLVMRGVSLPVVQAILGHSDIAVTQRYAHLAPKTLRDEMVRAFGEMARSHPPEGNA